MLTSIAAPRKKKPLQVGILALAMTVIALSEEPATAQERTPLASKLTPGPAVEVISPQATVVSTAHYQAHLLLTCGGGSACYGQFPKVRRNKMLTVTRVTCEMAATPNAHYLEGYISLINAKGGTLQYQFLPADYVLPSYSMVHINRAVDMQIAARQHVNVILLVNSGSTAFALCSLTGKLDTLG